MPEDEKNVIRQRSLKRYYKVKSNNIKDEQINFW